MDTSLIRAFALRSGSVECQHHAGRLACGHWPILPAMSDRSRFTIVPIGSLHTGGALKIDGVIRRSAPNMIPLAAYVDAIMAGADEADADNIAWVIEVKS
jgi:hypothetical protein